jgi:GntR family transcriptional regulator
MYRSWVTDGALKAGDALPSVPELVWTHGLAVSMIPSLSGSRRVRPKPTADSPSNVSTSSGVVAAIPDLLDENNEPWPGGTQHQFSTIGIEMDRIIDEVTARLPAGRGGRTHGHRILMSADRTSLMYTTQFTRWEK